MQAHSFELQDPIRGEVAYTRGGLVTQVKEPKQLSFRSLADVCTSSPSFISSAGHPQSTCLLAQMCSTRVLHQLGRLSAHFTFMYVKHADVQGILMCRHWQILASSCCLTLQSLTDQHSCTSASRPLMPSRSVPPTREHNVYVDPFCLH
jgi:hypothetical protein